jgi:site-specific recombinase XerD
MAVRHGRADPSALRPGRNVELSLERGRTLYMDFVGRPPVAGGVRPSSRKRYRTVFDKFEAYARSRGVTTWDGVSSETLLGYSKHLEANTYAYRTQYTELTTLKQAIRWLVKHGHLPADHRVELPMKKAQGSVYRLWVLWTGT